MVIFHRKLLQKLPPSSLLASRVGQFLGLYIAGEGEVAAVLRSVEPSASPWEMSKNCLGLKKVALNMVKKKKLCLLKQHVKHQLS
jgi:hypothetical protein